MKTKTVLITGCSTGIGRALLEPLLKQGWRVIATMRNVAGRRAALESELACYPGLLSLHELDVTASVERQAIVQYIDQTCEGKLDALVNNAGFGLFGALEDLSEEQIRSQLEVNVFGLILLTQALLPALRAAKGRIINLSSLVGTQSLPLMTLYCTSKFAVEGFSEGLYYELKKQGVQVAMVKPGGHRTKFGANLTWGARSFDPNSVYARDTAAFSATLAKSLEEDGPPPDGVVRKIVALLNMRKMPLRNRVGVDAIGAHLLRSLLPEALFLPLSWAIMRSMLKGR